MKTKTYNVYSFAELSPKARQVAIDAHRQFESENWDSDCTTDDAKQVYQALGFEIRKVYYSGFSSQGDGACFEGSWNASNCDYDKAASDCPQDDRYNRIALAVSEIAKAFPFASLSVSHRGQYSHEYCTDFTVCMVDSQGDLIETLEAQKAETDLVELSRDVMRWIYRQLEKDYEWALADEQIIENIEANEYEFTSEGKIAPRL